MRSLILVVEEDRAAREHEPDEIAGPRWRSLARLDRRMIGRGQGYDVDALDVDAAKSRHVHVQPAAHADPHYRHVALDAR